MSSQLNAILGLSVENVIEIHDYFQIVFSDSSILNVYNRYSLTKNGAHKVSSIKGQTLSRITETDELLDLEFSSGMHLVIDLRPEAYQGPEAVQLVLEDGTTVIWN